MGIKFKRAKNFRYINTAPDSQAGIRQMPTKCRRTQGQGRHLPADLDKLLRRQCRMPTLNADLI